MFPLFSSLKDPNLTSIVGHWGTNWLTNFLLRARAYQLTTSFDYSCNKREFNNNAAGTKVTCGQTRRNLKVLFAFQTRQFHFEVLFLCTDIKE